MHKAVINNAIQCVIVLFQVYIQGDYVVKLHPCITGAPKSALYSCSYEG